MTTLDATTLTSLRKALYAYIHNYGGDTIAEARAIAGALLTVKAKVGDLVIHGLEIETWVNELVQGFDLTQVAEQVWDEGEQAIATRTKQWRETLENRARITLDAYIQKFSPDLNTLKIQTIVATVLPIVEDAKIARDEGKRLIDVLSNQFDWQSAMQRTIDPKWTLLAETVMQCINKQDAVTSTQDVVVAYVHEFKPSAVEIGEGLVERAVQSVTRSKVELNLDISLDPETKKLLIKQVMFKFNLLEASPPPSKTALEIAHEVHDEVLRYRQEQGLDGIDYSPLVERTDETTGDSVLGGELGIGIELQPETASDTTP
ncbi:hypothetical protein PN498_08065 [Oscillatoria sp. CS-180]|uniref:hypothetical protein n=1 Tax=Oscillatoria sp. CS-180 TaxID=3021720 RepID=UPI00232E91F1|nr:hypothetical protein [Oscillatoria sp. CS-180]MDB9525937.1 hypothetical protein [Oscillatoria sp. CS-180]